MAERLELRFPSTMEAPATARHALDQLADTVRPEALEDIRLLVSELVTNSVRHAGLGEGGWVEIVVSFDGATARVEVIDPGRGFRPGRPAPVLWQESGWGLYLVEHVASRWGVVDDGTVHVWFEMDGATREASRQ